MGFHSTYFLHKTGSNNYTYITKATLIEVYVKVLLCKFVIHYCQFKCVLFQDVWKVDTNIGLNMHDSKIGWEHPSHCGNKESLPKLSMCVWDIVSHCSQVWTWPLVIGVNLVRVFWAWQADPLVSSTLQSSVKNSYEAISWCGSYQCHCRQPFPKQLGWEDI